MSTAAFCSPCASLPPKRAAGALWAASWIIWRHFKNARFREAREEVGLDVSIEAPSLRHRPSLASGKPALGFPAYLGRVGKGEAKNCEPSENEPRHLVCPR